MAGKKNESRGLSRTVERRLAEIAACERRGEPLKAYAKRTGQSAQTLYEAKRQARRAGVLAPHRGEERRRAVRRTSRDAPRFVEAVVATPSAGPLSWRLRLPSGAVLESSTPLDTASLERLVAGLRTAS